MGNGTSVAHSASRDEQVTGWVGWVYFAALLLILNGVFQTIMGIVALFNGQVYTVINDNVVLFNLATWGFVHILLGILLISAGVALFSGRLWARILAAVMAIFGIISQLMFISAYPFWSIIAIAIDLVIIYALSVHGSEAAVLEDDRT